MKQDVTDLFKGELQIIEAWQCVSSLKSNKKGTRELY